ncbi:hypothetical protein GIS00_22645 [Nakamurella sp. YIM 132087]|uniref:Uncharacterized protein n=1 Tax=Nakamurella alba TaxID=2665158 RepID=A0A7K1FRP5_9ACTN|nr:hypothetical protein [Nakamurella alba]MTD16740.1 hypothetical protein [Nakamurella alba]
MHPGSDTQRRSVPLAVVGALLVGTVVFGFSTSWIWIEPALRWFDGFVKSPGLGALGALVAAVVAYRAVGRRIRYDQDAAADLAQDQHWWDLLMWVYAQASSLDPDRMLRICRALADQAHTDQQEAMLAAIVEERLERGEEGS